MPTPRRCIKLKGKNVIKKVEKVEAFAVFCYHVNKIKRITDAVDAMPLTSDDDFVMAMTKLSKCGFHFDQVGKISEKLGQLADN